MLDDDQEQEYCIVDDIQQHMTAVIDNSAYSKDFKHSQQSQHRQWPAQQSNNHYHSTTDEQELVTDGPKAHGTVQLMEDLEHSQQLAQQQIIVENNNPPYSKGWEHSQRLTQQHNDHDLSTIELIDEQEMVTNGPQARGTLQLKEDWECSQRPAQQQMIVENDYPAYGKGLEYSQWPAKQDSDHDRSTIELSHEQEMVIEGPQAHDTVQLKENLEHSQHPSQQQMNVANDNPAYSKDLEHSQWPAQQHNCHDCSTFELSHEQEMVTDGPQARGTAQLKEDLKHSRQLEHQEMIVANDNPAYSKVLKPSQWPARQRNRHDHSSIELSQEQEMVADGPQAHETFQLKEAASFK